MIAPPIQKKSIPLTTIGKTIISPQAVQPNKKGMAARRAEFCENAQAWIARYLRIADRFFASNDERTPNPA